MIRLNRFKMGNAFYVEICLNVLRSRLKYIIIRYVYNIRIAALCQNFEVSNKNCSLMLQIMCTKEKKGKPHLFILFFYLSTMCAQGIFLGVCRLKEIVGGKF